VIVSRSKGVAGEAPEALSGVNVGVGRMASMKETITLNKKCAQWFFLGI
jgi:hypothetical protein